MVEVIEKQVESFESPKTLNNDTVCYWFEKSGKILGSMKSKALKLLRENCIEKVNCWTFRIKPIKGYNSTYYNVQTEGEGYTCSCQYNKRVGNECSHILAVRLFLFIEGWHDYNIVMGNKHEKEK